METNQQYNPNDPSDRFTEQSRVIPVIEEHLRVETREVETGRVRVAKKVHESVETVMLPSVEERVEVERIPRNTYVESVPEVRYEGDTMVIPILKEEVVTIKRLMLVEEVRITKHRTETTRREDITLRREEVVVERLPGENGEAATQ